MKSGFNDQSDQLSRLNKSIKSNRNLINSMNKGFTNFTRRFRNFTEEVEDFSKSMKKDYQKSFNQEKKDNKTKLKDLDNFHKFNKKKTKEQRKINKELFDEMRDGYEDVRDAADEAFDDIRESGEKSAKSIKTSFSDLADTLKDLSIVDSLQDIKGVAEESIDSYVELSRSIKKHVDWNKDQWSQYSSTIQKAVKDTNYQLSRTEMNEIGSRLVIDLGMDNVDDINNYLSKLAKIQSVTDAEISDLEGIIKQDWSNSLGGDLLEKLADTAVSMDMNLATNSGDILKAISENADNFNLLANGNTEMLDKMLTEFAQVKAAGDDSYYGFAADMLSQMSTMTYSQLSDLASSGLTEAWEIQRLMQKGEVLEAGKLLSSELSRSLKNDSMKNYLMESGIADMQTISSAITNGNTDAFAESLAEAIRTSNEDITTLGDKINEGINGPIEKMKNWFSNLKPIAAMSDLFSNYNVTLANAANMVIIGSKLGELFNLFKGTEFYTKLVGKLGGLLSKIPGLSKLGGVKGLGSKVLSGAKGLGSKALAGAKGLAPKVVQGAKGLGSSLLGGLGSLGTALGSGATTAGGAALAGGGAVAGAISGLLGIGSGIKDIYRSIRGEDKEGNKLTSKQKQDEAFSGATKIGMVGAGAGAGAAIGSVVPVLGTAVGALVGAGVGGIGALLSGKSVGKALSNAWDWTKDKSNELGEAISNSDIWKSFKDRGAKAFESLKDKAKNILPDFLSFGKDKSKVDGSHRNGLATVPRDGYIAKLHKGESVLTKDDSKLWKSLSGAGLLKDMVTSLVKIAQSTISNSNLSIASRSRMLVDEEITKSHPNPYEDAPNNRPTKTSINSSNNIDDEDDYADIINTMKWMVNRMERKLDELGNRSSNNSTVNNYSSYIPSGRKSDEVFQF